jgi:MtN3 and saliva related transmembrane protein
MDPIVLLGLAAGVLTTISLSPQLVKCYRSKSTCDLSSGYLTILCLGEFLWLVYGIMKLDIPIIAANAASLLLALGILVLKLRYG